MKGFRIVFTLICLLFAITGKASTISGKIIDRDTKEAIEMVTVQLLKADSAFVTGTLTNHNGEFKIQVKDEGKYLLRFTSVGYTTLIKSVNVKGSEDVSLGTLTFSSDAIMLKGATVVGQAAKVTLKEDTFQYNASAYRTPEGSVVEELVKKLPGAQVDDDGKITINGKEVKKILVDGKEFMTGDTKTAMKNLPTSIVEKVKAYDMKSDLARVTGIEDGEEETVLDFGIKKGMNKGTFGNVDASIGTKNRYAERLMGAVFNDKMKVMLFSNANNTNDMGFPGGGGGGRFGGNRQGLNATKMVGLNMNWIASPKFELNGSVRWNHNNGDMHSISSSENFVATTGSFSNSDTKNLSRGNSWNMNLRMEWKPDTLTNIMFRPKMSFSTSDGNNNSLSATFNDDPFNYSAYPLLQESIDQMALQDLVMNRRTSSSISYSQKKTLGLMAQVNRRLNSRGRNITLRGDVSYSDNKSKNLSLNNVHLFQIKDQMGNDSTYNTFRYNLTPTKSSSYAVQATYSEPIFRQVYLQFSYKFTYKYNKSDRGTYDFSNLGDGFINGITPVYRGFDNYFSGLQNPFEQYLDTDLSRFSEYKNYIHDLQLMLRVVRKSYQLNVGGLLQPQTTKFEQQYLGVHSDTTRSVVNFTPTLDFRYKFSKVSQLRINYRGTTSQPDMQDLMDITDDSDPLNIKKGNPGLKPSFTNSFHLFYNNYIQSHQRAIMTFLNYSNTRNSISNMVTYDPTTGGQTTRPENINGNWNVMGAFMFNTALDTIGRWNVNTFTNIRYNNYVGYLSQNHQDSQKNTTKTTALSERLQMSYRNDIVEVALDGSLSYTHTKNLLQEQNNMNTYDFAYGGSVNLYLPWGTTLNTDLHQNSRRGYNDNSMNTNELIWNAQISHSFLRSKALNVSLQFYDILHNQSNFSRTISAISRNDTQYNSISSYAMLHVIYRINLFGGKQANKGKGDMGRRGDMMPPFQGGFPGGGRGGNRGMRMGGNRMF